jgi:hypothetical protein
LEEVKGDLSIKQQDLNSGKLMEHFIKEGGLLLMVQKILG